MPAIDRTTELPLFLGVALHADLFQIASGDPARGDEDPVVRQARRIMLDHPGISPCATIGQRKCLLGNQQDAFGILGCDKENSAKRVDSDGFLCLRIGKEGESYSIEFGLSVQEYGEDE